MAFPLLLPAFSRSVRSPYGVTSRYYDAETGRWTSQDPLGLGPDVNPYRYAGNSPANATDPGGMVFSWLTAGGGALLGGAAFVAVAAFTDVEFSWSGLVGAAAGGFVAGAVAGALTGDVSAALTVAAVAKVGFFAGTAGGLTTGFISSAGGQFEANVQQHGWNTSQWNSMDWGKVWRDTAFAGISGGVTGAIGGVIGHGITTAVGRGLGLSTQTLGTCPTSWSQSLRQHATHAISGALGSGLTDATIQVVNISLGVQQGFNWRQLGSSVAIGAATSVASYRLSRACFAAGTKIMIPIWDRERHGVTPPATAWDIGWRNIEEIRETDWVLARNEFDPTGPLEPKQVEELFVRTSPVAWLLVGGQKIGTTSEHPFFEVEHNEWTPARELQEGNTLLESGQCNRWTVDRGNRWEERGVTGDAGSCVPVASSLCRCRAWVEVTGLHQRRRSQGTSRPSR